MSERVCAPCARRTWLLGELAGHLEPVRGRIDELLALDDDELVAAVAGDRRDAVRRGLERFDPAAAAAGRAAAGLEAVCRCDPAYPEGLRELPAPPAVLHLSGSPGRLAALLAENPIAVVGARRASAYGRDTARSLGRGLAAAGVTVISGMAFGIDAAAHEGALAATTAAPCEPALPGPSAPAPTIAVLAGGADRPYPAAHRRLHGRIRTHGLVVSELGPGVAPRRWMFPARNRLIAALAAMTVVVQARERSGSLVTARWAARLGREVGAVPGLAGAPLSEGPHRLLREGAWLIAGAQDALDAVYGAGAVTVAARRRERLDPALVALLDALADGEEGVAAFSRAGLTADAGLAALAALELSGLVGRTAGGRYSVRW
jgi:DNA processing protein